MNTLSRLLGAGAVAWLAGCASQPDTVAARERLQQSVTAHTGAPVAVPLSDAERADADTRVAALLAQDLTPESVVEIALLNNRGLRATFAEVGLSQADLLAAGLVSNPSFSVGVRWPHDAPRGPNVDFGLSAALLDVIFRPLRQRLAADELAQTERRLVHELTTAVGEVREAYFSFLAESASRIHLDTITETAAASLDLTERQYRAGNIPELTLLKSQAVAHQMEVERLRADALLVSAREKLGQLLGLSPAQASAWQPAGSLPPLPVDDQLPPDLEKHALDHRLDLAIARLEQERVARALRLERRSRVLPGAHVGVETERESDGGRKSGPSLEFELPLFDRGQADFARLDLQGRQAADRIVALESQIGAEVRTARANLRAARAAAELYEKTLQPHQRALLREELLHYNAMQHSVHELLAAKEAELRVARESLEALRDYWHARIELETALGAPLPLPAPSRTSSPASEENSASPHHPHSHFQP